MATASKQSVLGRLIALLASHHWHTVNPNVTPASILDADGEWVAFMKGRNRAKVLIVCDCEPYELIADYSCSLSSILDPFVDSLIEQS